MDNISEWILFYLVLPIVISILANLITPWVLSYIKKGSLSIREVRKFSLIKDYRYVKSRKENFRLYMFSLAILNLRLTSSIAVFLAVLSLVILVAQFSPNKDLAILDAKNIPLIFWILNILIFIPLVFSYFMLIGVFQTMFKLRNVSRFNKYREETKAQIIKLGGNPEDLDQPI